MFAISVAVLLLELALIRLIPSEVRAISYFTNLVLMAAFMGLAMGAMGARVKTLDALLPLGLLAVAGLTRLGSGITVVAAHSGMHMWLQDFRTNTVRVDLVPAALTAMAACTLPFVTLGRHLALAMDDAPRLRSYGADLLGSLAGSVAFTAASVLGAPPWAFPPLAMGAFALASRGPAWLRAGSLLAGCSFFIFAAEPLPSQWSPYYLVQHKQTDSGLEVYVNSSFHQKALDFARDDEQTAAAREKFALAHRIYQERTGRIPERVLILGAGTGNDVAVALWVGAKHVTAVEIDPVILELGRRFNTSHPYDDPRVHALVDDARHYLSDTNEKFDLVLFATLDSQTLLSSHSNVRLENFVYTQESFASVRRVLAPEGMLAAYYSVFPGVEWIPARVMTTLGNIYGDRAAYVMSKDHLLFNFVALAAPDGRAPSALRLNDDSRDPFPVTDEWPFLYLSGPGIPPLYHWILGAMAAVVLLLGAQQRRIHGPLSAFGPLFLVGAAFSLMEAAAVVKMSLLFGATWLTSAVVISGVLLTLWVANAATDAGWVPGPRVAWPLLVILVAANRLIPAGVLSGLPMALRVVGCVAILAPVFFLASVSFSSLFRSAGAATGPALGMNLLGAMAGGGVEYLSMLTGLDDLWLLAALLYLLAWLGAARPAPTTPSPAHPAPAAA